MKIRNIIYLCIIAFFTSCTGPKINYTEYKRTISDSSRNKFLKDLEAKDSVYSVILFTEVFKDDQLKVKNGESIIFDDKITSDAVLGLAKVVRIINQEDVEITDVDLNYSFILKKKNNQKYKFIYITKKKYENNQYLVTYSNSLRGFQ